MVNGDLCYRDLNIGLIIPEKYRLTAVLPTFLASPPLSITFPAITIIRLLHCLVALPCNDMNFLSTKGVWYAMSLSKWRVIPEML